MTSKIQVYVRAEGEPSHALDADIAGDYLLELDGSLDPKDHANAALDVFHSNMPVKVLDDFSFSVFAADGTQLDDDGNGDYRFSKRGTVSGKVDSLPFKTGPSHR